MSADGSSPGRERHASGGITREAHAYLAPTDAIIYQIECHIALGEALAAAGSAEEARAAFDAAQLLAEKKGGVVILSGVLRLLEDLDAAPGRHSDRLHQLNGPFVLALVTIFQVLGLSLGRVDRDHTAVRVGVIAVDRRAVRERRRRVVVEDLRDLVAARQTRRPRP